MAPPTLLLLPGLMCDAAVWDAQCTALARQVRCRVAQFGAIDSIAGMAQHVLATAPPGRFALAGHSMGGRVALEVARLAPARVDRLALLDTGFQPLPPGAAGAAERAARLRLLEVARCEGMGAMAAQWAGGMVHPDRLDSPLFDAVCAMVARSTPAIFAAQIAALLGRPDATPVLAALDCPVLLACGRQDTWSPLARHTEMQAAIAGSKLVVIEDAGHMTTMEQPAQVSKALATWLSTPSSPA